MRVDQAIVSFVTIRYSFATAWLWSNQTQTEQTGKQISTDFVCFQKITV